MTGQKYELVIPEELGHQKPALESDARYKLIRAGIRWGKSRLALIAAIGGHGRGRWKGIWDGVDIAWIVRDFSQARAIWREEIVPRFDKGIPGVDVNQSEWTLRIRGGGTLEIRTAENIRSVLGRKLGGVVFDEAAFFDLRECWEDVMRGRLIDLGGWAIFISSPNGGLDGNPDHLMPSYFNRLCEKQLRGELPKEWAQFHGTTRDNPKLPIEEVEAAYAEHEPGSPLLAQNLDAKLLRGGVGVAFPEWNEAYHTKPPTPKPDWKWFGGFDYGYRPDPAAFVLLGSYQDGRIVARWDCEWKETTPFDVGQSLGIALRDMPLSRNATGREVPCPELEFIVYDSAMTAVTDGGETILEGFERGLRSVGGFRCPGLVPSPKGSGSPQAHKMMIHEYLKYDRRKVLTNDKGEKYLPVWEMPKLQVHEDAANLRRALPVLPLDEKDPNKVDTRADDHAYDALRYALAYRAPIVRDEGKPVRKEGQHPGLDRFGRRIAEKWQENEVLEQFAARGGFTTGHGLRGYHHASVRRPEEWD